MGKRVRIIPKGPLRARAGQGGLAPRPVKSQLSHPVETDLVFSDDVIQYSDQLADPIPVDAAIFEASKDLGAALSNFDFLSAVVDLKPAFEQKIELLFDQLHVASDDPRAWELLARTLVERHVPGFRIISKSEARKRGAPVKWDFERAEQLIEAVNSARIYIASQRNIDPKNVSIRDACRRVIGLEPKKWPARGGGRAKPEDLQKRYNEALKAFDLALFLKAQRAKK